MLDSILPPARRTCLRARGLSFYARSAVMCMDMCTLEAAAVQGRDLSVLKATRRLTVEPAQPVGRWRPTLCQHAMRVIEQRANRDGRRWSAVMHAAQVMKLCLAASRKRLVKVVGLAVVGSVQCSTASFHLPSFKRLNYIAGITLACRPSRSRWPFGRIVANAASRCL